MDEEPLPGGTGDDRIPDGRHHLPYWIAAFDPRNCSARAGGLRRSSGAPLAAASAPARLQTQALPLTDFGQIRGDCAISRAAPQRSRVSPPPALSEAALVEQALASPADSSAVSFS